MLDACLKLCTTDNPSRRLNLGLLLHPSQDNSGLPCSISGTKWAASPETELFFPWTSITYTLEGVAVATKFSEGITASVLVKMVESVRTSELLDNQGIEYTRRDDWKAALQAFHNCMEVCFSGERIFTSLGYRALALRGIECVRAGVDQTQAIDTDFEGALQRMPLLPEQINMRKSLL